MGQAIFLHRVAMPFGTRALQGVCWGRREAEEALGCHLPQSRSDVLHEWHLSLGPILTTAEGAGKCKCLSVTTVEK